MSFSLPTAGYRKTSAIGGGNILQLLMSLVGQSQQGYGEAKAANENRYLDILSLLGVTRNNVLGDVANTGQTRLEDIRRQFDTLGKEVVGDLANRGLSGSSQRAPLLAGVAREGGRVTSDQLEKMRAARADVNDRYANSISGVMERRSDPYPEQGNSLALITQLASLLGGGGGLGGLQDLLGGGRMRQRSRTTRTAPLAPPVQNAPYLQRGHTAEGDIQAREQNEMARRNAMIALQNATQKGGYGHQEEIQQALNQLVRGGWAEQNPAQGVPVIDFMQTHYAPPSYVGGGRAAAPNNRLPSDERLRYLNEIGRRRTMSRRVNSPSGQAALAGGNYLGQALGAASNYIPPAYLQLLTSLF